MARRRHGQRRPTADRGLSLQGKVRDMARGGEAVVETESGLVFVRGALPDEQVRLRGVARQGKALRGELVEVIETSPERVAEACPLVTRCGGCPLMHASAPLQSEIKRGWLDQALSRTHFDAVQVEYEVVGEALGYRRRARMAGRRDGGDLRVGFRRERSRKIVDLRACPVLEPALQAALHQLRQALDPVIGADFEIAFGPGRDGAVAVVLRSEAAQPPDFYQACGQLAETEGISGVALYVGGVQTPARWGDPEERSPAFDGSSLEGAIGGFSQANARVNERLVSLVSELADTAGARVLELYAGHGNLTVALAPGAHRYTAVEQDPAASEACRQNLQARNIEASVVTGAAEQQLGRGELDVAVLDPPRGGAPGVLAGLARRRPARLVYVSCDTATLGRDLAELSGAGYRLSRAVGLDMFPQTAELESVVLLERGRA